MTEQQFLELKVGDMVRFEGKVYKITFARTLGDVKRSHKFIWVSYNGEPSRTIFLNKCKNIQKL